MGLALTIKNKGLSVIEKHVNKECKKFEKILDDPKVNCKILNLKKGICVKISLNSGSKVYSGEASGMQMNVCINKAVKRLMRLVETDKEVLIQKKHQHHMGNTKDDVALLQLKSSSAF
ncbi:MAG: hypothetical protein A2202_05805 [Bdellovibrionales bacterium RIFOXYA1_FULL_36_14]|nr:MAG: hypothetical protein A2202_05805 [Bdellovibrionales bacterium RIFOXYA1_FULL_36_14]